MRFMAEAIEAVGNAYSRDRIGIRISPYGTFNDIDEEDPVASFIAKLDCSEKAGIGFVHIIRPHVSGSTDREVSEEYMDVLELARARFSGKIIAAGGYDRAQAETELRGGSADFIAFGRPFIPNPDLPRRLREGLPLAESKPRVKYDKGPEGYIDYPPF
jgi:N-ethylmaleimide reductase